MSSIFIDTNILIDVLAKREPHFNASAKIWSLAETGKLKAAVSAISFNNVHYLMRRFAGDSASRKALSAMRASFHIVPLDEAIIDQAINSGMKDFEDAIQLRSAILCKASCLVSRNIKDFPAGIVPILTPEEYLAL